MGVGQGAWAGVQRDSRAGGLWADTEEKLRCLGLRGLALLERGCVGFKPLMRGFEQGQDLTGFQQGVGSFRHFDFHQHLHQFWGSRPNPLQSVPSSMPLESVAKISNLQCIDMFQYIECFNILKHINTLQITYFCNGLCLGSDAIDSFDIGGSCQFGSGPLVRVGQLEEW